MKKELENILFINTGGGIGDALSCLPTLNFINNHLKPDNLYYFATDLGNFWFENKLKEYKPKNLITIKDFPDGFGYIKEHLKISKKLIDQFEFNSFDLIVDNQSRFINTLVYKKIPHKYYVSPCLNYLMCKPFVLMKKRESFPKKIIDYFNKINKTNFELNYKIQIPKEFVDEANKLIPNNNYIGFSITAGHPFRKKEINIDEIIKVANYFSEKYIPAFFIEKKYDDIINKLKQNVNKAYFPEEQASDKLKKPMLVTALGALTKFNITIDNGISHMLSFSENKNFVFYNKSSIKFKPLNKKTVVYDCSLNNTTIDHLNSEKIIEIINKN